MPNRRIDADVQEAIQLGSDRGLTAAQIRDEVATWIEPERLPSLRTFHRAVADLSPRDSGPVWSVGLAPRDGADFVLAALRQLIGQTDGAVTTISVATAEQLAAIHLAAPDLEPWPAYRLARWYVRRAEEGRSVSDLDAWVAFAPWRNADTKAAYERAVEDQWIEYAPIHPIKPVVNSEIIRAAGSLSKEHIAGLWRRYPDATPAEILARVKANVPPSVDPVLHEELADQAFQWGWFDKRPAAADDPPNDPGADDTNSAVPRREEGCGR